MHRTSGKTLLGCSQGKTREWLERSTMAVIVFAALCMLVLV